MWHTQVWCKGVLCCIFTNTRHLSNFLYIASLVTVHAVMCGFHYIYYIYIQVLLKHSCIILLISIQKCVDKTSSSWWKTNLNSWSVDLSFIWRRHFLLYTSCDGSLLWYVSFLKHRKMFVNQDGCVKMTSYSHDMTFHQENGRMHLLKTFK